MATRKTITLSFSEYDIDIYNFLKSQSNASAYVRRLVLAQISNAPCPVASNTGESVPVKSEEVVVTNVNPQVPSSKVHEVAVDIIKESHAPSVDNVTLTVLQPIKETKAVEETAYNIVEPLSVSDDFDGLDIDDL